MKLQGMISHFILFILLMLLMWVGVTYVSQNIQYSSAKKFHSSVVEQIENSYFDKQVIRDCERKAEENSYRLRVESYDGRNGKDAKVRLELSFTFPVLQRTKQYVIEGYAR